MLTFLSTGRFESLNILYKCSFKLGDSKKLLSYIELKKI